MINLIHGDCMEYMATLKDNEFDLAVVDPPYGIKINTQIKKSSFYKCDVNDKAIDHEWDDQIPSPKYFEELMRVSKYQIIWGGNYFLDYLSNTRCMLVWDKNNGTNPMADCELAWTNLNSAVRKFTYHHLQESGPNNQTNRIHPTQKPVRLYQWIFDKYAKKGWRILDTHLGSGSSAIAAHDSGLDFVGIELDGDYFQAAKDRLERHQLQLQLPW